MASPYSDSRAHALRERYVLTFGGPEFPVPVDSIAEDLLGLRIEERQLDWSGMLLPVQRTILLSATESPRTDPTLRRQRFTIAHEIGHWICHCVGMNEPSVTYCRPVDLTDSADRALEREANVFAAELLMPEHAVRAAWEELGDAVACAASFDVSPSAMQWRLYSYGLGPRPSVMTAG